MITLLVTNLWFSLSSILFFYLLDHLLTLYTSQLYIDPRNRFITYEGGVELNPIFQKEVNANVLMPRKFLFGLLLLVSVFTGLWFLTRDAGTLFIYEFALGVLILVQAHINIRHLQNVFFFKEILNSGLEGHITYGRRLMYAISIRHSIIYAGFYFFLYLLTNQFFFLGGFFGVFSLIFAKRIWARRI